MSNVMFTLLSHGYTGHSRLIRSCGKNIGVIYRGQERDSNTAALIIREVQIMLASVGTDSKLQCPPEWEARRARAARRTAAVSAR